MSEKKTNDILHEIIKIPVDEVFSLLESKLGKKTICNIWELLSVRGVDFRKEAFKNIDIKSMPYPFNIILLVYIENDLYVENMKYITEYEDISNIIKEYIKLYNKWFNQLIEFRQNVLVSCFKEHIGLKTIAEIYAVPTSTVDSAKSRSVSSFYNLMNDKANDIISLSLVTKNMENDKVKKFLDIDIHYAILNPYNLALVKSEGYGTIRDLFIKTSDNDYITSKVENYRSLASAHILNVLYEEEYTDKKLEAIKNTSIEYNRIKKSEEQKRYFR